MKKTIGSRATREHGNGSSCMPVLDLTGFKLI